MLFFVVCIVALGRRGGSALRWPGLNRTRRAVVSFGCFLVSRLRYFSKLKEELRGMHQ